VVSVVLPIFNERTNLAPLLAEITTALADVPHEVIAVDDGSTDGSLEELHRLRTAHSVLRVVSFERRSGQSAALSAGFDAATGAVVVTLDADGQNDPRDIPALLAALDRDPSLGAAVGYRQRREDTGWKRLQSRVANVVRNWITRDGMRDTGCSLKAMRRERLTAVPRFDGMHRFLPALIQATGGSVCEMPVAHRPRRAGQSKYGMWDRALRGIPDALAVRWFRRRALRYAIREETGRP
jgi:glycosyltransferase involved in cell wall biosynthesis